MIGSGTKRLFVVLRVVLGLVYVVPLLWIVITSLKTNTEVLQDPNGLIFAPTLATYASVIRSGSRAA